jgi:hypothetical protein
MSKILSTTAAAIALSVGIAAMGAAPALASNYHDYHPWALANTHAGYASQVYSPAESRGGGFAWSAQHLAGYDGGRYWWRGDCWPTDPGGCDWAQ